MSAWPEFTRLDDFAVGPVQFNPANVAYVQDDVNGSCIVYTNAVGPLSGVWVKESRAEVVAALAAMQKPGRANEL